MYFGLFESANDVANNFGIDIAVVKSVNMIAAKYTYEEYCGSALVLFEKDGKIFKIEGEHCSCYDLSSSNISCEGDTQWQPEEISLEYLRNWVKNLPSDFGEMKSCVEAYLSTKAVEV